MGSGSFGSRVFPKRCWPLSSDQASPTEEQIPEAVSQPGQHRAAYPEFLWRDECCRASCPLMRWLCNLDVYWNPDTIRAILGSLPRRGTQVDCEAVGRALESLASDVGKLPLAHQEPMKSNGSAACTERHSRNSRPNLPISKPATKTAMKEPPALHRGELR